MSTPEIFIGGEDPSRQSNETLGPKGLCLAQLGWWGRSTSKFAVPQFAIAPSQLSDDFIETSGQPPEIDYGLIPEPGTADPAFARHFEGFYSQNRTLFDTGLEIVRRSGATYIGSSLTAPSELRRSFAGVNSRTTPRAVPQLDSGAIELAVERALSGLFRPYTELYLRGHNLHRRRRTAAIMFYEFIAAGFEAVAYVHRGDVFIERKELAEGGASLASDLRFSLGHPIQSAGYWAEANRAARVADAIASIMESCAMRPDDILEVEFCFDARDVLYVLQYRAYPPTFSHASTSSPIFASVGTISGPVRRVAGLDVTMAEAQSVVDDCQQLEAPIWLVDWDRRGWDSVRLLWLLDHERLAQDLRIVAVRARHDEPSHVTAVLREDPRVGFFGQLHGDALGQFPGALEDVTIEADGLICRLV